MKNRYLVETNLDLRMLRHDLRGLITPLNMALESMKAGQLNDGLDLQDEVLKKLKVIVSLLDEANDSLESGSSV